MISLKTLEELGRTRLSPNFFMRDFLYSEISQIEQIANVPVDPELAVLSGKQLCANVLEPIRSQLGTVSVRSAYRSPELMIMGGYALVVVMTVFAPREIIAIAYDSGGVTTSTITVPLVTALGIGLASSIRGRNPLVDGFGLIALASLMPMIFVMAYAQLAAWRARRSAAADQPNHGPRPPEE